MSLSGNVRETGERSENVEGGKEEGRGGGEKVATSGQHRPHAMGKNACVFVGGVKEQVKRGEEERGGGGKKRGGRDLSLGCSVAVCLNERASLSLSLCCTYGFCPSQRVEHMSRANTDRLSTRLRAGTKLHTETVAETATSVLQKT